MPSHKERQCYQVVLGNPGKSFELLIDQYAGTHIENLLVYHKEFVVEAIGKVSKTSKKSKSYKHVKEQKPKKRVYSYSEYLHSNHWLSKRQEAFEFYGAMCQACKSTNYLHVHHVTYKTIGKEPMNDLRVLCSSCHDNVHKIHTEKKNAIKKRRNRRRLLRHVTNEYIKNYA